MPSGLVVLGVFVSIQTWPRGCRVNKLLANYSFLLVRPVFRAVFFFSCVPKYRWAFLRYTYTAYALSLKGNTLLACPAATSPPSPPPLPPIHFETTFMRAAFMDWWVCASQRGLKSKFIEQFLMQCSQFATSLGLAGATPCGRLPPGQCICCTVDWQWQSQCMVREGHTKINFHM